MKISNYSIPENTDSVKISQIGSVISIEFIPKEEELKDLDCVKITYKNLKEVDYFVLKQIIKDTFSYYFYIQPKCGKVEFNNSFSSQSEITKITRQEMQAELAKHGKVFDFEEKVLKDLRWRAEKNKMYYAMDCTFEVCNMEDNRDVIDNNNFNASNYFRTNQDCQSFCDKVKKLLNN